MKYLSISKEKKERKDIPRQRSWVCCDIMETWRILLRDIPVQECVLPPEAPPRDISTVSDGARLHVRR